MLWCTQDDAAAKVEAEVDGGGGALKLGDARKTKQKGPKGKRKVMTLRSYLKGKRTCVRHDNQGATKQSCRLDFRRSIKQRSIMDSFVMTGDVTPVYSNQRR